MTTETNYTKDEQKEIAMTIINQMGGAGKLKAMLGVKTFGVIDGGVVFQFKMNPKMNKCEIKLNGMDLYDMKFFKHHNITGNEKTVEAMDKKIVKSQIVVEAFDGIYNDMLKPIFESTTGLRLSLF